jgi:hypothetical protein
MSNRSSELYRDRHLISEGWLPPREAKVLRGDLEVAKRELDNRFQWQVHLCNDKAWRPYSAMLCSNCRATGTEAKSMSVGDLLSELEKLRDDLDKAHQDAQKLRGALVEARDCLVRWKAYFQADIPRTADEQEEMGEQFTAAWFETDRALATATPLLEGDK